MKRFLTSGLVALLCVAQAFAGTVTGQVQNASGGSVANGVFSFTLTQGATVSGTASVVSSTVNCYTDANGNVVGEPNPLVLPLLSANTASGTLAAATYFVKFSYFDLTGESIASSEQTVILGSTGSIIVTAPVKQPAGATGYKVYSSNASGTETLQGSVTGTPGSWANFTQSVPLVSGAALPSSNTTACKLRFNDELTPSFVCYDVGLSSSTGNTIPGFPQYWYMSGGSSGSINIGLGTPQSNVCQGAGVFYPQAILTQPPFNGMQSINGPINMNGWSMFNTGPFTALTSQSENNFAIIHADQYSTWVLIQSFCIAAGGCTVDARSLSSPTVMGVIDPGSVVEHIWLAPMPFTVDHFVERSGLAVKGMGVQNTQGTKIQAVGTGAPFIMPTSVSPQTVQGVVLEDFSLQCTVGNTSQDGIFLDTSVANLPAGSAWEAAKTERVTISGCFGSQIHLKGNLSAATSVDQFSEFELVTGNVPASDSTVGSCYRIEGSVGQVGFKNLNCTQQGGSPTETLGYIGVNSNADTAGPNSIWFEGTTLQNAAIASNISGCSGCTFRDTHLEADSIAFQQNIVSGSVIANHNILYDGGLALSNVANNSGAGIFLDLSSANNSLGTGATVQNWTFAGNPDKLCKGVNGARIRFINNTFEQTTPSVVTTNCSSGFSTSTTTLNTGNVNDAFVNGASGGPIVVLLSGLGPGEILTLNANVQFQLTTGGNIQLANNSAPMTFPVGSTVQLRNSDQSGANLWYLINSPRINVVAQADFAAQTAAQGPTTLLNAVAAGEYELTWDSKVTTAGSTSTLGPLTITYTDPDSVVQTITAAAQVPAGTIATSVANGTTTTGNLISMPLTLNVKAGTNIQFAFGYASSGTVMNYNLHLRLKQI